MKFLTKACFGMLLAASAMSTPAFAQEEEASGPVSLSGGVSVVSDYRFRGISLSNARDYLSLPNVVCVGGSWVAPKDLVAKGDWAGIEKVAAEAAALKG